MISLRPFNFDDTDYRALLTVYNTSWPERPATLEEKIEADQRSRLRDAFFMRLVIEENNQYLGDGTLYAAWWSAEPGHYMLDLSVLPGSQQNLYANVLYEALLADADQPLRLLEVSTFEDRPTRRAFLETKGFKLTMRNLRSQLDVTQFSPEAFAHIDESVSRRGIEILDLVSLAKRDPAYLRQNYELEWQIVQDIPTPTPLQKMSFDKWKADIINSINHDPRAWFVALDGERYVGMSTLWTDKARADKLHVGLTGVLPPYRRQGIATALKLRTIAFAKAYGARIIETDNEENNPMYALNEKLGFKPAPAWLSYHKSFRS